MSDLHTGANSKKQGTSVKFLAVVLGLAVLVFVGAFGSIFLKEIWERAADAKKVTAPELDGSRPGVPGVSGGSSSGSASSNPQKEEVPAEAKPDEAKPADTTPAEETPSSEKP